MDLLAAHSLFARANIPPGFPLPKAPGVSPEYLWPCFATAAVLITDQLEECLTGEDLERAFMLFLGWLRAGKVDRPAWSAAAWAVAATVEEAERERRNTLAEIAASN